MKHLTDGGLAGADGPGTMIVVVYGTVSQYVFGRGDVLGDRLAVVEALQVDVGPEARAHEVLAGRRREVRRAAGRGRRGRA